MTKPQKSKKQKQKQKSKSKQKSKQKVVQQVIIGGKPHLSSCIDRYLSNIADPFNATELACVPDTLTQPSRKVKVWVKDVIATTNSTTGLAFISVSPYCPADDSTTVNFSCFATDGGWTSSSFPTTNATGVSAYNFNSGYSTANINNDNIYRPVSCGIRVRRFTPHLDFCTSLETVRHPNNGDLGGKSVSTVRAWPTTHSYQLGSDEMFKHVWTPINTYDTGYRNAEDQNHPIGIVVSGPPTQQQSVKVEFFAIYEFSGTYSRGMTKSETDPTGFAAAMETLADYSLKGGKIIYNKLKKETVGSLFDQSEAPQKGKNRFVQPVSGH